jgi:hypothetical protein
LLCGFWAAAPAGEADHFLAFATGSVYESEASAEELMSAGKARVFLQQKESFFHPVAWTTQASFCRTLATFPEHPNAPPRLTVALSGRSLHLLI